MSPVYSLDDNKGNVERHLILFMTKSGNIWKIKLVLLSINNKCHLEDDFSTSTNQLYDKLLNFIKSDPKTILCLDNRDFEVQLRKKKKVLFFFLYKFLTSLLL